MNRNKPLSKILAWVLAFVMVFNMMPVTAGAEGVKASPLSIGTAGITVNDTKANTTKVYMGTYSGSPIAWYLIKADTAAWTLLAEESMGTSQFHASSNAYATSTLKTAVNNLLGGFSDIEKEAMNSVDLTDVTPNVSAQKLWPLSIDEVNLVNVDLRTFTAWWWLRSPNTDNSDSAFAVSSDAKFIQPAVVFQPVDVRPAFELNLSSVLFTSDSSTSGAPATADTSLTSFSASETPQNLKLTLDSGQTALNGFSITNPGETVEKDQAGSLELQYSEGTNSNHFIRVQLSQNGEIKYTGVMASGLTNAGGTASIPLTGVDLGTYDVKAWVEQGNAAMYSNIGTTPVEFSLNVTFPETGLTVSGGVLNTDYTYSGGVLTIISNRAMTITGTTSSECVVLASGITANITINGLNIHAPSERSAFGLTGTAKLNLTLEGSNFLQSGSNCAGIQVPSGAELTITAASTGSLTATGGIQGAGIGGAYQFYTCGTVTINGGTVTATGGNYGTGIGGGAAGNGGTVTITGGTVIATAGWGNPAGAGIGTGGNGSSTGTLVITGGSVKRSGNASKEANATNGSANVYLTTLTVGDPAVANADITAGRINGVSCAETPNAGNGVYGIKGVKTDEDGKLYYWLPEANDIAISMETGGIRYEGTGSPNAAGTETVTLLEAGTGSLLPDTDWYNAQGGDGQTSFNISTAAELAGLSQLVNAGNNFAGKTVSLTADIDLTAYLTSYEDKRSWMPIGRNGASFNGIFDGNNHTISGLYINDNTLAYAGLFGYINGAAISNLRIEDANVTGANNTGGIAGAGYQTGSASIVNNCQVSGTVKGAESVGGIVGFLDYSRITGSSARGEVTGTFRVGGIAGYSTGNIANCYSMNNIKTTGDRAGGIAGQLAAGADISNCYATGAVSGRGSVGGIVGDNGSGGANHSPTVQDCAALNISVTGTSNVARVTISSNNGSSTNNIAFAGMIVTQGGSPKNTSSTATLNLADGLSISKAEIAADGTLDGRFANDGNPWTSVDGSLPGFGAAVTMLEHLVPPVSPAIITVSLPDGLVGTDYSATLEATGGGITWSIDNGTLPAGLDLNDVTGAISGTPSAVGTFDFTVKAANEAGDDTEAFSVTISKQDGAAVDTPVLASVTKNSININAVTPPANGQMVEYAISTNSGLADIIGGWQDELTFSDLNEYTTYYVFARSKENDDYNAGAESTGTAIRTADETAPTGTVTIKNRPFASFINFVSFGLFFKDMVSVSITGEDSGSGVEAIHYFTSETDLSETTDWSAQSWTEYSDGFNVTKNFKGWVYARISDNENNTAVIRSDGIVVFGDAEAVTTNIEHTKGDTAAKTATVTLNGNTIDRIVLNGNVLLTSGEHYIHDGDGTITFPAAQLNTLPAGDHMLTVYYNPQGVTYDDTNYPGDSDPQPTTAISLTVRLASQTIAITDPGEKTYGDSAFGLSLSTAGDGDGAVAYSVPEGNGILTISGTTATIVGVGTVTVTATKAACDSYEQAAATLQITVSPRDISNTAINVTGDRTYTGSRLQPTISVTDSGAAITTSDYDITDYGANINAGTNAGSVTIAGQGNYTGTKTESFNIEKAASPDATVPGGNIIIIKSNTVSNIKNLDEIITLTPISPGQTGDVSYVLGDFNDNGSILTAKPTLDGTALTYQGTGKTSGTATLDVIVKTANYEDVTVTITFEATYKNNVDNNITFEDGSAPYTSGELSHETALYNGASSGNITYAYAIATDGTQTGNESLSNGKPFTAGIYIVTAHYEDAENIGSKTVKFTVDKAVLTAEVTVNNKAYDGTTDAEVSAELKGVYNGDDVELTNVRGVFASADVGDGIAIQLTEFGIDGADAGNYTLIQPTGVTANITAGFTPVKGVHYTIAGLDAAGWSNTDVTITAESDYSISLTNTAGGAWANSLTYSNETDDGSVTFYVKNTTTGEIGAAVTESYKIDTTAPTATVQYKTNGFKSFLNTVTFGLFFKATLNVTILGADTLSGVAKVEYYKSATEIADSSTINAWTADASFSVTQNEKFILYVRVTDAAGNTSVIYSDGVVVYTDSEAVTANISFTRNSSSDVTATVKLNGNTIEKITNGAVTLDSATDYSVDAVTGVITFAAAYLDTLAASATPYTLTIYYNPLGEAYADDNEGYNLNEAPAATTISLTVSNAAQTGFSITNPGTKIYGDAPFQLSTTGGNGGGAVTYELMSGTGTVTAEGLVTITGAGDIEVKSTKAADSGYDEATATITITVNPKVTAFTVDSIADMNYNGSQIMPAITVRDNGVELTLNTDYTVSYGANVNAGTGAGSVSITGAGNYLGSTGGATFNINKIEYAGTKTAEKGVLPNTAESGLTVTLPAIPDGAGHGSPVVSGALVENPSIANGILTFDVTEQPLGEAATITIPVTNAMNYNDYYITITVTTVNFSATLSGNITGYTDLALTGTQEVTISLVGDTFVGTLSGEWISNLPSGLSQSVARIDDTTAKITVSGTAASAASGQIAVTIPAGALTSNSGTSINATSGASAVFDIITSIFTLAFDGTPGSFTDLTYGYDTGSSITYTVKNTGNQTVNGIEAIIREGGGYFMAGTPNATTLAPGETTTVTVTSKTGLGASETAYAGTLHITWTGGEGRTGITQSLSQKVNKAEQATLRITGLEGSYEIGTGPITLGTSGGSGTGAVTYETSDDAVASVDGDTLTIHKKADFTVTATKAGDDNYNGISSSAFSITVTDTTAPTGDIKVKNSGWKEFLNNVTFGLFFKDTVDATIAAEDNSGEGVTVEYYLSAAELTEEEAGAVTGWITGQSFSMEANNKYIIYARLTDTSGNAAIMNSEGIVVYTDSVADTTEINHIKFTGDKTADVTLNGNTIDKIRNGSSTLVKDTDYTVSGSTITFRGDYLDGLAADDYTLTIHYNPMGLDYTDGDDNDIPATTEIALTVSKATVSEILAAVDDVSMTAYEAKDVTTAEAVVALAGLPSSVEVTLTDGGTATLGITWATNTEYHAKGAEYAVTGTLVGNADIDTGSTTKQVTVMVTAIRAQNPTFADIYVLMDATKPAATASDLGPDVLPGSGTVTVDVGGAEETVGYTIAWSDTDMLDMTAKGNDKTFTGEISYPEAPDWLTLPDATVTRKVIVTAAAKIPVTVSFHANGGTGSMESVSVRGGTYTLPSCNFNRSGYTFAGWKVGNTGTTYAAGSAITVDGDITLYAQWNDNGDAFNAVTDITGVPTKATVGTALTLTGTVQPSGATNKTIQWTVKSQGATGARITNGRLSTTGSGMAVITATIKNGKTGTVNYTKDFSIRVSYPVKKGSTYTVSGYKYKITSISNSKKEVTFAGLTAAKKKTATTVNIKGTVKIKGITMKITAVGKNALKRNKKVRTVKIGNHVQTIGYGAFSQCTTLKTVTIGTGLRTMEGRLFYRDASLKTITIKSTKLKSVKGTHVFVKVKATVKVPASKVSAYRKLLKGKSGNIKVTK